jgi:hypothetical protein
MRRRDLLVGGLGVAVGANAAAVGVEGLVGAAGAVAGGGTDGHGYLRAGMGWSGFVAEPQAGDAVAEGRSRRRDLADGADVPGVELVADLGGLLAGREAERPRLARCRP